MRNGEAGERRRIERGIELEMGRPGSVSITYAELEGIAYNLKESEVV